MKQEYEASYNHLFEWRYHDRIAVRFGSGGGRRARCSRIENRLTPGGRQHTSHSKLGVAYCSKPRITYAEY